MGWLLLCGFIIVAAMLTVQAFRGR